MTIRHLPNHSYTNNEKEYCDAWLSLAKPIEEATGTKMYAFDPMVSLHKADQLGSTTVQLPVWFVERLNVALAAKTKGGQQ